MLKTLASALALLAGTAAAQPVDQGPRNTDLDPAFPEQTRAPARDSGVTLTAEPFAEGLENPWAIAELPDGAGFLVTERPGRLRHVSASGEVSEPIPGLPEVLDQEQGGLLDVALDPGFADNRRIWWTYAKPMGDGLSATAAARGTLSGDMAQVTDATDVFVQEPPSPTPMHYGSRIDFDDAGHVFITTGEHFTEEERQLAQDPQATYGKVIRLNLDGSIPEGNPFAGGGGVASIWSLGHRNIQAAAVRPETGAFWLVEHGPQGGDELNRTEAGANYGWPVVTYGENYDGSPVGGGQAQAEGQDFVQPVYFWDPVIAPSGMTFVSGAHFPEWEGDALVGGLIAGSIVRLDLEGTGEDTRVTGEERLAEGLGRLRDLLIASDGAVMVVLDESGGPSVQRLTRE